MCTGGHPGVCFTTVAERAAEQSPGHARLVLQAASYFDQIMYIKIVNNL